MFIYYVSYYTHYKPLAGWPARLCLITKLRINYHYPLLIIPLGFFELSSSKNVHFWDDGLTATTSLLKKVSHIFFV